MQSTIVTIVRTGVANTAAVLVGFKRAGAETLLTSDPLQIERADRVVIPGVGAFGAGMQELQVSDLVGVLKERLAADRPTLAICLGVHLLCKDSEETKGVQGLSAVDASVKRFPDSVKVPQIGWNKITAHKDSCYLESGYAYFANSYHLDQQPTGWKASFAEHGKSFVAAMERGNILACQFHPELSGAFGLAILKKWIKRC